MPGRPPHRFLLLPALLLAPACGADEGGTGWTTARDTLVSGAVLVVNTPPAEGIRPTWRLEEELRIGSVEGDGPEAFGRIKGFGVLPDGRIAVLDAQAQEVRIFGEDGAHLATYGRKGEGPGEFMNADGLVVGGDGLIRVHDPRNARLTVLDPDSGVVGSERLQIESWGFIWAPPIDSAGRIYDEGLATLEGERWRVVKVLGPAGDWADTIRVEAVVPGGANADPGTYVYSGGAVIRGFHPVPYWPGGVGVLDPPTGWWFKPPHENAYRLVHASFDGDTLLVVESRRPARPVTDAERDSAIAAVAEATGQQLDWSRIPAEKPVVEGLFLARDGRPWVRVGASDSLTTYDIFERDGVYAGTVETPFRVYRWLPPVQEGDLFHAVITGELDVQQVVRARLVPLAGGPGKSERFGERDARNHHGVTESTEG